MSCPNITLPAPANPSAKVTLTLNDFVNNSLIVGATLKACDAADTMCSAPLDTQISDANGMATLTVSTPMPSGYVGYVEVTSPSIRTTLIFLSNPLAKDLKAFARTFTPSEATLVENLAQAKPEDPTRGAIGMVFTTCQGAAGSGLVVDVSTADANSTVGYVSAAGVPDPTLMMSSTSAAGYALNIPAGAVTVTSHDPATNTRIAKVDIFVRAGAFSELELDPTP